LGSPAVVAPEAGEEVGKNVVTLFFEKYRCNIFPKIVGFKYF
jgi:hypothetical protein